MAQMEFLSEKMPDIIQQWQYYFKVLEPGPGDTILDVGCGTGDAEILLTRLYPEIKKVIGIDHHAGRYQAGLAKWQANGQPANMELKLADALDLPFEDGSFDRAFSADALEWIKNPQQALQEMKRVLKPGGVLVMIHSDFDSQLYNSTSRELTRRITHLYADSGPDGQLGRKLFSLCKAAGFTLVKPFIYTLVNTAWEPELYGYQSAYLMADWLNDRALLDRRDMAAWIENLENMHLKGQYFYSINRNLCYCQN